MKIELHSKICIYIDRKITFLSRLDTFKQVLKTLWSYGKWYVFKLLRDDGWHQFFFFFARRRSAKRLQKTRAWACEWCRCGFRTRELRWKRSRERANKTTRTRTTTITRTKMKRNTRQTPRQACVLEVSWFRFVR